MMRYAIRVKIFACMYTLPEGMHFCGGKGREDLGYIFCIFVTAFFVLCILSCRVYFVRLSVVCIGRTSGWKAEREGSWQGGYG